MVADAAGAYAWLASRSEIDPARIGLVGASIGANLALNFAAGEPAVKTLVLLSPGLNYRGVTTEDAMTAYGRRPVMLVSSAEDREAAVAVDRLQQLAQGQQSVLSLQDQGHGTAMLGRENGLEDAILKWLRETL
jgi:dienelactone hydrolase